MKKTITALLLSLVTVLCLTAVAWGTEGSAKPDAPGFYDLYYLEGTVKVKCVDAENQTIHETKTYKLLYDNIYTVRDASGNLAEVVSEGNKWTYTFWLDDDAGAAYADAFDQDNYYGNGNYSYVHKSARITKSEITLEYVNNAWKVAENGAAVVEIDDCNDATPAVPSADVLKNVGKVIVSCHTANSHSSRTYSLISGTYTTDVWSEGTNYGPSAVRPENGEWCYDYYIHTLQWEGNTGIDSTKAYVDMFSANHNKQHLMVDCYDTITLVYRQVGDNWEWVLERPAEIETACTPTAAELAELLKLKVNVQCKDGTHAYKTYDQANLLPNTSLDFNLLWNNDENSYEYKVTLTPAAANSYVADYSTAVGKTHTLKDNGSVTIYWYTKDVMSVNPTNDPPIEVDPDNPDYKWMLTDNRGTTFTLTATDTTPTGGTGGGFPFKDSNKTTTPTPTVSSAKTFDAGTAMYAGLAILSLTGSAMVIRKKEF